MPAWTKILTSGNVVNADLSGSAGITSDNIADGTIDAAAMAANSVDSSELVNGSVDLAHMSVNSIDSDQYVDGSIDLAHMSVNSIDSDQYVDGSIEEAHIANDAVNFLTHLKAGVDGELITWDASANPARVSVGDSGHVLTSGGTGVAPTFQAVPQGDIEGVTAGVGLSGGGSSGSVTLTLALSELTTETALAQDDFIPMVDTDDSSASNKITFSNFEDEIFGNIGGDAAVAAGGALTIAADAVTYAKMQNVSATNVLLGRDSSGAGIVEEISASNVRTILNVSNGADSTETWMQYDGDRTIGASGRTMTLDGNLVVSGTTTTISSTTLEVADKLVKLANVASPTTSLADDSGIQIESSATEVEWPHIRWKDDGDLTGWGLADHVGSRLSVDHYPISVLVQSTTTPTSQAGAGIGTLWFETDAEDLYIRTS